MAQIASLGSIPIDDTELIDFSLEVDINYAIQQKQRNGCIIQHTGLSFKRATLVVRLNNYTSYTHWNNLINNYNKQILTLTIAGNTERSWLIESLKVNVLSLAATQWECTVNLIG
jgi:hypothetical protein